MSKWYFCVAFGFGLGGCGSEMTSRNDRMAGYIVETSDAFLIQAIISDPPSGLNALTAIDLPVVGEGVYSYEYAIVYGDSGCSAAEETFHQSITQSIHHSLDGADGIVRLCLSGFTIDGRRQESPTVYTWTKDTQVGSFELSGLPNAVSGVSQLNLTVDGAADLRARYMFISETESCDSRDDWSDPEDMEGSLSIDVSALSDGAVFLCVILGDTLDNWQAPEDAHLVTWEKDSSAPTISVAWPADSSSDIMRSAQPTITFSETIVLSSETVAVELHSQTLDALVPATLFTDGSRLIVQPDSLLDQDDVLTLQLTQGITDRAGNPIDLPPEYSFSTSPNATQAYLFYNESAFDEGEAAASATDVAAFATDKKPLYPGRTATTDHFSSYRDGINGIAIDLPQATDDLSASDFAFHTGNDDSPDTGWTAAAAPTSMQVLEGQGVNGTDRVLMTWAAGTLTSTWLEITVLANERTGLASPDRFYFGSVPGDANGDRMVNFSDYGEIGSNATDEALVDNVADLNRDGAVDADDYTVVGDHFNPLEAINLITPAPY